MPPYVKNFVRTDECWWDAKKYRIWNIAGVNVQKYTSSLFDQIAAVISRVENKHLFVKVRECWWI